MPRAEPRPDTRDARVTRAGQVVAHLRTAILDGTFPPGAPLRELGLAERYGVSRRTVREALLALAEQGLVVRRHNTGAAVRTFTADDVADLYRVRRMLESEGARSALTADAGALATIDTAFEAMERAALGGIGSVALAESDMAFHGAVIALSGSPRIDEFYARVGTQMTYAITMLQRADEAEARAVASVLAEHRAIRDAVVNRDLYEAQRLILEHIGTYERTLLDARADGPGRAGLRATLSSASRR